MNLLPLLILGPHGSPEQWNNAHSSPVPKLPVNGWNKTNYQTLSEGSHPLTWTTVNWELHLTYSKALASGNSNITIKFTPWHIDWYSFSPNSVATLRGSCSKCYGPVFSRGGLRHVRHFPYKFPHKMALMKCPCAFRLRRLAQNACPGIEVRHFSCKFPCKNGSCEMSMCVSTVQARTKCWPQTWRPSFFM